ncbi:SRPBCC family protein [Opitutus terrae]|uniref:Cyclase/dehydrase n=1 Tax=Opitutus terrae (strain DSM 11246 / JCM 15787 / PB90-1) TaxID=452637 RepID=B1ZMA4_OPITP|nr:SRPBCC family protein [Opitutus terrae]ACB73357.1 cyclase/dehydrase [Opitutus terrae PB90-1]
MATSPATRQQTADRSELVDKPRAKIAVPGNHGVKVVRACTIRRPAAELYQFWRSLENLTRIIKHPVAITRLSDTESHWAVSAPGDRMVEWDAVIINDAPDRLIAWRSKDGAEIRNAGSVRFERAPGDEGTEVRVQLEYDPPGGKLAAWVAKLTGEEPEQQVAEALRRFKALMEAGEIPTIEGQSVGEPQRSAKQKGQS